MAEYIEREALIKEISESTEPFNTGSVFRAINKQPAADVVPVVHGRWIDRYGGKYANQLYECSECKRRAPYKFENDSLNIGLWVQDLTDYCPNCGAKMDKNT